MIRAFVFDLDGTLVETEELKALSYARAATQLRRDLNEGEVVAAFGDLVGLSRQEVAVGLMRRFGLEDAARARMAEFDVGTPWQAYVQIRLGIYEQMLGDPKLIQEHCYPHNIALLRSVRQEGFPTALATQSHREQSRRVLGILGLEDEFDVVVTRDDDLLDRSHVVDDPRTLPGVVHRLIGAAGKPPQSIYERRVREGVEEGPET